jgi:phosphate acetyltransferase
MTVLDNRTYDELRVGDSASLTRTLALNDIAAFAAVSGDNNPAHLDAEFAAHDRFGHVIAHGLWSGAMISAVLGTRLPGPGTIYLGQSLAFRAPVSPGDTITATVTVTEKRDRGRRVTLACSCTNQLGVVVLDGTAEVIAPATKVKDFAVALPQVQVQTHQRHEALIARCADLPPLKVGVVHPCDAPSLGGALAGWEAGLIAPTLIGPRARIEAAAEAAGVSIAGLPLIDVPHSHAAADTAAELAQSGAVEALMKGSLHTDELMAAVIACPALRTGRRMSHVFVMDAPAYPRLMLITDAAINIAPNLDDKRDICQNAIDLARALGIAVPKVAIVCAVETVSAKMPATLDAAALCKMADRGQIKGGVLDGPLAFDTVVDAEAARIKGLASPVAGLADILLVPDLEAGNMLAKQLEKLAGADSAGIVVGARLPIILTSRSDSVKTRLASCAVAVLAAADRRA